MSKSSIEDILIRLHALEDELESALDQLLREKREQFRYTLKKGKVRFEQGVKSLQKHQKVGVWLYILTSRVGHLLSAPIVYSVFMAFIFLDISATLYQHICFRIYAIPRVVRSHYIVIDRHHLAYLNIIEKFNCVYCGYANGLIEYVREIAARTEQYWCPVKHAQRKAHDHRLSERFVDYGDAEAYSRRLEGLRNELKEIDK